MNADPNQHLLLLGEYDGNGNGVVKEAGDIVDLEALDDEMEEGPLTAATLVKTLPADVTMIVQNHSYTLKVLESYRRILAEDIRKILQKEGHRSHNFRRYGEVLRNINAAIKLKTEFVQDLFRKLRTASPENISRSSYTTIVHYQRSLLDYRGILISKQRRLQKERRVLKDILLKIDETFVLLQKRAKEISELLSSITSEEITSYPPHELDEFRAILESSIDKEQDAPPATKKAD